MDDDKLWDEARALKKAARAEIKHQVSASARPALLCDDLSEESGMSIFERAITVAMLISIAIAAISWIGEEFYALLAMFDLLVGVLIGMTIFTPNRKCT